MNELNAEMQQLYDEQFWLQYCGLKRNNRSRTLENYDEEFGMPKNWLRDEIVTRLGAQSKVVLTDLGCGDAVILREAMLLAESLGFRYKLRAIGVDILPFETGRVRDLILKKPQSYSAELLRRDLDLEVFREDIDQFAFPEEADIVTFSNVLFWTRDPLRAVENAAQQVKPGGILAMNGFSNIFISTGDRPYSLSEQISKYRNNLFPGFEIVNKLRLTPDELVLRRIDEEREPLFVPFSSGRLHLERRAHLHNDDPFAYLYAT
jgi:SAM-dependent methyltransferase